MSTLDYPFGERTASVEAITQQFWSEDIEVRFQCLSLNTAEKGNGYCNTSCKGCGRDFSPIVFNDARDIAVQEVDEVDAEDFTFMMRTLFCEKHAASNNRKKYQEHFEAIWSSADLEAKRRFLEAFRKDGRVSRIDREPSPMSAKSRRHARRTRSENRLLSPGSISNTPTRPSPAQPKLGHDSLPIQPTLASLRTPIASPEVKTEPLSHNLLYTAPSAPTDPPLAHNGILETELGGLRLDRPAETSVAEALPEIFDCPVHNTLLDGRSRLTKSPCAGSHDQLKEESVDSTCDSRMAQIPLCRIRSPTSGHCYDNNVNPIARSASASVIDPLLESEPSLDDLPRPRTSIPGKWPLAEYQHAEAFPADSPMHTVERDTSTSGSSTALQEVGARSAEVDDLSEDLETMDVDSGYSWSSCNERSTSMALADPGVDDPNFPISSIQAREIEAKEELPSTPIRDSRTRSVDSSAPSNFGNPSAPDETPSGTLLCPDWTPKSTQAELTTSGERTQPCRSRSRSTGDGGAYQVYRPSMLANSIRKLLLKELPEESGFIYVFKAPEFFKTNAERFGNEQWVKIGIARNMKTRLSDLRNKCGIDDITEVWGSEVPPIRWPLIKRIEKVCHEELNNFRRKWRCSENCAVGKRGALHCEWFAVHEDIAVQTVKRWRKFLSYEPYTDEGTLRASWKERVQDGSFLTVKEGEGDDHHEFRNKHYETWLNSSVRALSRQK